jgi:hypothetical protein
MNSKHLQENFSPFWLERFSPTVDSDFQIHFSIVDLIAESLIAVFYFSFSALSRFLKITF